MAIGLGVLRLGPHDFWAMTPREFASAVDGLTGGMRTRPMDGRDLTHLMQLFPD